MKQKFSLDLFLRQNAIPILLLTSIFSSVIYIYSLSDGLVLASLTVLSFIYFTALFLFEDFLMRFNKGWFSFLAVSVLMLFFSFVSVFFIETRYRDTMKWFLDPKSFSEVYTGNIIFILLLFGFIIGSALFYFTRVRFRAIYVFLICICPFSLFAKSFTDIPVIYTIIIITLFFLLVILNQTDGLSFAGRNKYAAIGAFIVVISIISAFSPKLEFAPYREEFDELITGINITAARAAADFNEHSYTSGTTGTSDDDTVLYTLYGDNPVHLKRQCFNSYNKEDDLWEYSGGNDTGYNHFDKYVHWENPSLLAEEYGITMPVESKSSMIFYEAGDSIRALYTCEDMTNITLPFSSQLDAVDMIYRNSYDEYFTSTDGTYFKNYELKWCKYDIDVEHMLNYTDEKAESIGGYYSSDYLKTKNEMRSYMEPLMSEEVRRNCYRNEKSYGRVRELVSEITANCYNDYEKAVAIEQYFKSSEYVYDVEFYAGDKSVENFIFNTKRGACGDYATAMTLMCREAGLYSRYVEGFLVQKSSAPDVYHITANDSHAYVQVWLDGYGWTDFDPTSSNIDNGGYTDPTFIAVGVIMLVIACGGIVFFIVRPVINEKKFIRKTSALRGREQLLKLYPRISEIVHNELRLKPCTMTVSELKTAVFENFSVDISITADDFEACAYGDIDCGENNYMDSYLMLKQAIKQKKKEERKNKIK